jgi:hypothetical protein
MIDYFLRCAWQWKCGRWSIPREDAYPGWKQIPQNLNETEGNPLFRQLAKNRLIMGAFRYELWQQKRSRGSDFIGGLKKKIAAYEETGNLEHLIDASNYCELEFTFPRHPNAYFHAEDDHLHCPTREDYEGKM